MAFTRDSTLGTVLDHADAAVVVRRFAPGVVNSPLLVQLRSAPLGLVIGMDPLLKTDPAREASFWSALGAVDDSGVAAPRPERVAVVPRDDYDDAPRASARLRAAAPGTVQAVCEIVVDGPSHGNPFVDVEFSAEFRLGDLAVRTGGFYDGDGVYRARFLPREAGVWSVTVSSSARSLDGLSGTVVVEAALPEAHGPVRVADTFHFAHEDGTRHVPLGTTAYAWTHQGEALEEATLATLAESPFTKVRMCVFPKAYLYNTNEPELYPFSRGADGEWDVDRPEPAFFRHLEERVADLAALGIQADLILFHAYDRWGFSDMGRAADDLFTRYVVRRLAAHPNVWWSLANEYDLLWSKSVDDWERLAAIVVAEDPVGHLLSIHNCFGFYDYTRPWITHASVQRIDVYRTAENTDAWREEWGKPVVIDECAYEGDIDQGWGNITGEEMTRRFWEGAVRGGYVGHGETYLNDREELWWSKGGELIGDSPARIAFLRRLTAEMPGGRIDPLPSDWDAPWGGSGSVQLVYFGFNRPSFRTIVRDPADEWIVDVVDTWGMTVSRVPGTFSGSFRVELPARQFMAIRLTKVLS
ncbi:alpha-L-rhamnosidase [Rathayibacter sp. Leaf185]|uniref:DUF5605 domain-containing protein n=1 Tax=Rathayibacter sp. Leaf185 TaxID=1736292 RepID=UPI0006F4B762|nr:DUF5605 domain-containing protein [Rathayibacter sp. Leaf185]KQQ04222.1 alpha-L-rhamnosidase [Rathayibacter sp. Leaf294]KQS12674.1 alpha-L-rhamnosidase [Rathayibacter sp. Leaf185]